MEIEIGHLLEGARNAKGLTVIIDVFRAFTLEAYMYQKGAVKTIPVGSVEDAFLIKKNHPDYLLCGERHGKMVEGFDMPNAPSFIENMDLTGKTIIHTTSAGVQGIVNAKNASEIITGSFVNAKAIARYIEKQKPEHVTFVAMGWEGNKQTEEDELCAQYIQSLVKHEKIGDIDEKLQYLKYQEGKKFFDPLQQSVFPERDFWLSIDRDILDFVIQVYRKDDMYMTRKVEV